MTKIDMPDKLMFGVGNAKLSKKIATFSLPAGFTCPGAKQCLSRASRDKGQITDGPDCCVRCMAASQEAAFPSVRRARWRNYDKLIKCATSKQMMDMLQRSLPKKQDIVRYGASGDIFSEKLLMAWLGLAWENRNTLFYGYTKSIPWILKHRGDMPDNFKYVASMGGKWDTLAKDAGLPAVHIVMSTAEADDLGLSVDHDDSHAMAADKSFALLLHGTQPAGSAAGKAMSQLRKEGWTGYSKRRKA